MQITINRNGRDSSQTSGKRMSASNASGQQSRNNTHQQVNKISALILFVI
ncbi:MAG: hypothetical protein JWQ04_1851 [Pedosphaera sp.]|nr:hypothetical protein [Pedosphaera sp.]